MASVDKADLDPRWRNCPVHLRYDTDPKYGWGNKFWIDILPNKFLDLSGKSVDDVHVRIDKDKSKVGENGFGKVVWEWFTEIKIDTIWQFFI